MAGNVLWHVTMSLDGFIGANDGGVEWGFGFGKPGPVADEVIEATGAILAGRRGYDYGIRQGSQPKGVYGGAWSGPMFVLTHRPLPGPEHPEITFLSDGIENAVATAQAAAAGKSVGIFGASIARQCLEHGLIDEIVMHLVPILLGEGIRFYDAPGVAPIRLERIAVAEPSQLTDLRFRVLKDAHAE